MFNFMASVIQIGNSTQVNNVSINPNIDVLTKRIKQDFFDGRFKQAIDDLDGLIKENSSKALKTTKYQLSLLKISFLLQVRKMDDFEELIKSIESNYTNEIDNDNDTKFQELKLTLMAFNKNEYFSEVSNQLRIDTPNSKPQGHFDIIFYLNSGDLKKAKEIFEKEIQDTKYKDSLLLIGGHIYSNLYEHNENDMSIFDYADKYYKEALEKDKLSFLDTLQIQGFYATFLLNNSFKDKTHKENLLFSVQDYKKSLDIILKNKEYFNTEYMKMTIDNYFYVLAYLGLKDKCLEFYKHYEEDLGIKHYIQYCGIKNIKYEHTIIQDTILNNYQLNDLLVYVSLIPKSTKENTEEIINFLQDNSKLLYENNYILYNYIKGKILLVSTIENEIKIYLETNKYNDLYILLAFIEQIKYDNNSIDNKDIKKLIEFSLNENNSQDKILSTIIILEKLDKKIEYIDLALSKQSIFGNVIFETLKICENDKNLLFADFEYFINKIDKKDGYSVIIGNICVKHDKHELAFNYYYSDYKKRCAMDVMFAMLQEVLINYHKTQEIIKNHEKIFNSILVKIDELPLEELFFILQYSIEILKNTQQVIPTINKRLLRIDIKNENNDLKIILSDFYTQTMFINEKNFENLYLYGSNNCLFDGTNRYVISNAYDISEENKNNFGFISIDSDTYFLKEQDSKTYHKESLLHNICGGVAFNCNNPNMRSINVPKELLEFMEEEKNNEKALFQKYSDGHNSIGLYALAKKSYKDYFTLIPYMLNNKKLILNSLKPSYLRLDKKKILTFSSIIFLDEIGKLGEVLARSDIVIQKTLTNWLKEYLDDISATNMPIDINYLDDEKPKFVPYTSESIKQASNFKGKISAMLIKLLNCDKVNDTSESLPIKDLYADLAPFIGTQEYQALAYSFNHDYQIVSENNIFDFLSEHNIINKASITNSIALLIDVMELKDYVSLLIDLDKRKYKYVLSENYENDLISIIKEDDSVGLLDEKKKLLKIATNYGFL